MSITIRLARFGKKNAPAYKVVVAQTRSKRNGKFIDVLGYYNPSEDPNNFELDKEKFEDWKAKGALTTDAVEQLVNGTYTYTKYKPKKKGEAAPAAVETAAAPETPAEA